MDGQQCDRHASARAQARVIFPNLGTLYFCMHCADTLDFGAEFHIDYLGVTV